MDTGMHTGLPAYKWLAAGLKAEVVKGRHGPGERLASEHDLARQHGLARVTVRKATELLVAEGVLERRPGKGLFVREKAVGVLKILAGNLAWEPSIRIVRGAQQAARKLGYEVQVCDAHGDASANMESVARLAGNGTRGAVIMALHTPAFRAAVSRLKADGFPFVLVDTYLKDGSGYASVAADNYGGGFVAGTQIAKAGHRCAGFIGDAGTSTVEDRLSGFRDGLAEFGVVLPRGMTCVFETPDPFVDWGEYVREACAKLLGGGAKSRPSAVFCSCDAVARVVYRFCAEKKIRIPDDLGVVGFDDDPLAEWLSPGLTTVRQPFTEMGAAAMRLLEAQLTGIDATAQQHIALPVEWVGRGSLRVVQG